MDKILVSSCLLGENTKYNGKNNYTPLVEKLKEKYEIISVCPEVFGGLPTPRFPSEIRGDKVINDHEIDVTNQFNLGAEKTLKIAIENNVKIAVLKESSPSCGSNKIYDGFFSKTKISGQGITAKRLIDAGIKIYTENDIEKLL